MLEDASWEWLRADNRARIFLQDQVITGEQLTQQVCSLADQLTAYQLQGRLAVCQRDPYLALLMALACLQAGWLYQPISPRWPLAKRLELALQAKSMGCWPSSEFPLSAQQHGLQAIELNFDAQSLLHESCSLKADTGQTASTLFTSGSTGEPKALTHSIAQHLFAARYCNPILQLTSGSCWLLSLPMFHASGYSLMIRCLLAGAAIAIPKRSGVSLSDLQGAPITHVSLVATQLRRLLQEPEFNAASLPLTTLMLGGGPIPTDLIRQAKQRGFRLLQSYGLTETAAAILLAELEDDAGLQYSEPASFKLVEHEILLRGEQIAQYYQLSDGLAPLRDGDGWFASGDLGFVEQHKLYIVGRKDNLFISGGENIQPELIERTLCLHPDIELAMVVPVAHPEFGLRPLAFVQPTAGAKPSGSQLAYWLRDHLPGYMCPVEYVHWPSTVAPDQKPVRREFIRLAQQRNYLTL